MEKNEVSAKVHEEEEATCYCPPAAKFMGWVKRHPKITIAIGITLMLLPFLAFLVLLGKSTAAGWTSPIVYPSPQGYGAGNWYDAYDKARALVSKMTLEEMNNITYGISDSKTGCVGVSGGVPRFGFPGLCQQDGPAGVRNTDGVNGYAAQISIGASWNRSLAYQRALYMGAEFKTKGVNVALGPVVGPIGRIAEGGRNWEGFGADPYLSGILGAESVKGLQESVIASVKHFVVNEQETNRNPISDHGKTILSTSANVDDRTMHELYMWPFQDLVYAGAGCVMCSYNRINQTYGCENSKTTNGLLKGELNFQGFVVSDWSAQHSGILAANAGLDMAMPTSSYWNQKQLAEAVKDGNLNKTRLADMATRILATWYQFKQDEPEFPKLGIGMPKDLLKAHHYVDAKDQAAKPSLLQQAIEGHVLVKNINGALPLNKPKRLSVFGYGATVQDSYMPGTTQVDGHAVNLFPTNWDAIGLSASQLAAIASNMQPKDAPESAQGTLFVGGGSGSNTPAYISSPYNALQAQAYEYGFSIFYDFASTSPHVAAGSDACLVFINEYASESWDRPGLANADSDELVENVASSCNNTLVVIHNAGIRLVDAWIESPNVTAVIFGHLPGQDAGRAVVQILFGEVSPSGRLPYTIAKAEEDYGHLLGPCEDSDSKSPQCNFSEGVEIDYRSFLARNVIPRYEFGYGLTYSSFRYSDLKIQMNVTGTDNKTFSVPVYTNGTTNGNKDDPHVGLGGLSTLFENVGSIEATITNTGHVEAAEVAQLYIQSFNSTRTLRGFEKVSIPPGNDARVKFNLRLKDISSWSTAKQSWVVPSAKFDVFVGRSVLDTPLAGSFSTS